MKFISKNILIFLPLLSFFSCGSIEYEIEEHNVSYTEKLIVIDTIYKEVDTTELVENSNIKTELFSYIVQVGAFHYENNFAKFFENAKQILGEKIYYKFIDGLYKIRIGNFNTKGEALKYLETVKQLGFNDAFIITVKH